MNKYTMNVTVIILGIILVFLVYILYTYFLSSSTTLTKSLNLNVSNKAITSLANPGNSRYAYSVWVYVNSWNNTTDHTIFAVTGNGGGSPYSLKLYLDTTTPTLYCDIGMNSVTIQSTITNNFAIQKWVFVTISVDNQFLDYYLDGKLVKSTKAVDSTGGYPNVGTAPPSIYFGMFDAHLANMVRYTAPLDPQTVWNTYLAGNGQSKFTNYGFNVEVLQNNTVKNVYKIF
jgi:hypothetical protein